MDKVKTIFLGTGWESVECLRTLHESDDFEIVCAITTPDKPIGRKQLMTPSEVKVYCLENNIPVLHTEKSREKYMEIAKKFNPDIVVCKAFGEIVPKEFLDYPRYRCINIHFSILPKYRGAVPIQKAILDGEKETGISLMVMTEGLDEGDILDSYKQEIRADDTNISLRERLVKKSTEILLPALRKWINNKIVPKKQDDSKATFCWQKDISKEKAEINWEGNPEYIERMIRAFLPWPVAWTRMPKSVNRSLSEKIMKIYKAELVNCNYSLSESGKLFSKDGELFFTTSVSGKCLKLFEFQIEGKNKTTPLEFLNGIGRGIC